MPRLGCKLKKVEINTSIFEVSSRFAATRVSKHKCQYLCDLMEIFVYFR